MPDAETAARAVTGFEAEIASLDGNGVNATRGADGRLTSTIVDHFADEVTGRAGRGRPFCRPTDKRPAPATTTVEGTKYLATLVLCGLGKAGGHVVR